MEAGNRYFDQRVPEETNRKLWIILDVNLTYSDIAREYLFVERRLPADRINIKTGSHV
jgi:UDP-N-acetylglucosamine 2-epimerase